MPPIFEDEVVLARPQVIVSPIAVYSATDARHLRRTESLHSQQLEYRGRMHDAQEFSMRVGPEIFTRTSHRHCPRGEECNQLMLVNRKVVLAVTEAFELRAEPMGKGRSDPRNLFLPRKPSAT